METWAARTVVTVVVLLLMAGVCVSEYDLYCVGSSYIIDHQYIESMADSSMKSSQISNKDRAHLRPFRQLQSYCAMR